MTALSDNDCEADEFLQLLREQVGQLDGVQQELRLARLQLALRSLDEASISTIHSFCQRSLQEQALAGNQLFESELLSNDDAIWEMAIKDWWRRLSYDLDQDTWQMVRAALGTIEQLTATLLQLRNKPSAGLLPAPCDSLQALLQKPRQIAEELHRLAPLWLRHKAEIRDALTSSKALSRVKKLPYHGDNIDAWLDAADYFFNSDKAGVLFDNFQYLGSEWLLENSKSTQKGKDPRLEHEFFQSVNAIAHSWDEFRRSLAPQLRVDALLGVSRQVLEDKRELAVLALWVVMNVQLH